jgi:hypothetical protein
MVLIDVCARRETWQWEPGRRVPTRRIEVCHATVVEVFCDGDCEPRCAACNPAVAAPVPHRGHGLALNSDSVRGREIAA